MFAGATSGRRKRLVVSGIERDNWDAIEGLQKWCEVCGHFSIFLRCPVPPKTADSDRRHSLHRNLANCAKSHVCPMVICTSTSSVLKLQIR